MDAGRDSMLGVRRMVDDSLVVRVVGDEAVEPDIDSQKIRSAAGGKNSINHNPSFGKIGREISRICTEVN